MMSHSRGVRGPAGVEVAAVIALHVPWTRPYRETSVWVDVASTRFARASDVQPTHATEGTGMRAASPLPERQLQQPQGRTPLQR